MPHIFIGGESVGGLADGTPGHQRDRHPHPHGAKTCACEIWRDTM